MPTREITTDRDDRQLLRGPWDFCSTVPDECADPRDLDSRRRNWLQAEVPATVAGALRAAGEWSLDGAERRFDAEDWWFRLRFDHGLDCGEEVTLGFDGLATLCEIWLNGVLVCRTDNMFVAVEIGQKLEPGTNEICLVFRSLDHALSRKRPRPAWRTPMVNHQQLRWFRTTLLGRTPGWSPPAAPVGPWKAVWLQAARHRARIELLHTVLQDGLGMVRMQVGLSDPAQVSSAELQLLREGSQVACVSATPRGRCVELQVQIPDPDRWWPHGHGDAALYDAILRLRTKEGVTSIPAGRIGFREVELLTGDQGFALKVNGTRVFCKGACWTPLDVVSLRSTRAEYLAALEQVRHAGFNMLRVGGTFVYESPDFLELCDELGIMVWQDFMFASMDYPLHDEVLEASATREAEQQLARWAAHPCIAVTCGNSEVSQQAAMWGVRRESWNPDFFSTRLPSLVEEHCPGTPYWPSSAHGGAFPHQVDCGTTSYYGIGAYLRPLEDLRLAGLRFATECLAFANIPEPRTLSMLPGGHSVRTHHAVWKQRAPRDLGAGWDFEDVRDHYLGLLYGVDPVQLRCADHARYVELSRRVPAEVMSASFIEWRRQSSACAGAFIWFLRDLWPGAGWGIIDSTGLPKAPFHLLGRTLQPRWIWVLDHGLNGAIAGIGNETPRGLSGRLEATLYRDGRNVLARGGMAVEVPAWSELEVPVASLMEGFLDITHAYRFGPRMCDLIVVTLRAGDSDGAWTTCYLPDRSLHCTRQHGVSLSAVARMIDAGTYELTLRSAHFLRSLWIEAADHEADDQYFDLAPGETRKLLLKLRSGCSPRPLRAWADALNCATPVAIEVAT